MSLYSKVDDLATQIRAAHQNLQGFVELYPTILKNSLDVVLFVDPDLGDDVNDGLSWELPKATIEGAIVAIPSGGSGKINLVKGKTYTLAKTITCANKYIFIEGIDGFDYTGTYATIQGTLELATNNVIINAGFQIGQNGFLYIRGCRLLTARYTSAVAGGIHTDYGTSMLNTNSNWGTFWLEHCQVVLNNGPLMHQHSAGSYGCADLFMREIEVTRTPAAELVDTRRSAVLMGTHGNQPIPFRLFAVRMILTNIATLKELFSQTLVAAKTNVA